jgi:hypothetical protein
MMMMIIAQVKIMSYYYRHPDDDFILLTINIFGCLHQLVYEFFSSICQHGMVSEMFINRVFVALQRVQASIILCRAVVAAGETSFRLGVLPSFSAISLHDLLRATRDGFRSYVSCFLLLGLPIVRYALPGVVFGLDLGSFIFSSLVPLPGVFHSFIYLFTSTYMLHARDMKITRGF